VATFLILSGSTPDEDKTKGGHKNNSTEMLLKCIAYFAMPFMYVMLVAIRGLRNTKVMYVQIPMINPQCLQCSAKLQDLDWSWPHTQWPHALYSQLFI